jgi:hypothetical protein
MKLVHSEPGTSSRGRARRASPQRAMAVLMCALLSMSGSARAATDGASPARPSALGAASPHAVNAAVTEARQHGRERWHDETRAALTQASWRWLFSIPPGVTPNEDTTGVNCGINQQGRHWFLGGPVGSVFSRECVIPLGRAIVVPVFAFINDYPCPDPNFKPPAGQSLEEFLQVGVAPFIDGVTLAEARLDGRALRVRRITTDLFGFTAAAGLNAFDPCVTGSPQVGVSDGYWVFIDPLPRGDHVLVLRSVSGFGTTEGTYTLRIR